MKIAVAGTGYVGLVTAVCLAERGHFVTCVDIDQPKIELMKKGISPIFEKGLEELMQKNKNSITYTNDYKTAYKDAEVIFIGVGTPEQEDGSANLTFVRIVSKQIAESVETDGVVIVVKSTVPIGTNDEVEKYIKANLRQKINVYVASNPEFLSQGSAVYDTLNAKRIVIGTEDEAAMIVMKRVYSPFKIQMVFTNRKSAEMIKYASNDFLALKISYINDIANLCELVGANIDDVAYGMSLDPRIGDKFLNAGIGYGGSCFPKDTKALFYLAKNQFGYEMKTIEAAINVNTSQKTKLFYLARHALGSFDGKKVTLLGLTFKPGTDDLREAPSIEMTKLLLKDGAKIKVYDPIGSKNFKKLFPVEVEHCDSVKSAVDGNEIIFILTEWPEIKNIDSKLLNGKHVYDGRNCLNKESILVCRSYVSIGRPNIAK